ncbi:hypothetical protein H4R34_001069 [Dimargaris verticillata]|uniref:Uncharacterized protein n=1 Tax=Dimargaris verticillata TaxID=2761393 RepID=A0A9W8BC46_9FUNG|nr:hypothetical protein H4R34_001069 [Dimargaris verticillata]
MPSTTPPVGVVCPTISPQAAPPPLQPSPTRPRRLSHRPSSSKPQLPPPIITRQDILRSMSETSKLALGSHQAPTVATALPAPGRRSHADGDHRSLPATRTQSLPAFVGHDFALRSAPPEMPNAQPFGSSRDQAAEPIRRPAQDTTAANVYAHTRSDKPVVACTEALPDSMAIAEIIDRYQSQPELLKLILQAKAEEDRWRAEEERRQAVQLSLDAKRLDLSAFCQPSTCAHCQRPTALVARQPLPPPRGPDRSQPASQSSSPTVAIPPLRLDARPSNMQVTPPTGQGVRLPSISAIHSAQSFSPHTKRSICDPIHKHQASAHPSGPPSGVDSFHCHSDARRLPRRVLSSDSSTSLRGVQGPRSASCVGRTFSFPSPILAPISAAPGRESGFRRFGDTATSTLRSGTIANGSSINSGNSKKRSFSHEQVMEALRRKVQANAHNRQLRGTSVPQSPNAGLGETTLSQKSFGHSPLTPPSSTAAQSAGIASGQASHPLDTVRHIPPQPVYPPSHPVAPTTQRISPSRHARSSSQAYWTRRSPPYASQRKSPNCGPQPYSPHPLLSPHSATPPGPLPFLPAPAAASYNLESPLGRTSPPQLPPLRHSSSQASHDRAGYYCQQISPSRHTNTLPPPNSHLSLPPLTHAIPPTTRAGPAAWSESPGSRHNRESSPSLLTSAHRGPR